MGEAEARLNMEERLTEIEDSKFEKITALKDINSQEQEKGKRLEEENARQKEKIKKMDEDIAHLRAQVQSLTTSLFNARKVAGADDEPPPQKRVGRQIRVDVVGPATKTNVA